MYKPRLKKTVNVADAGMNAYLYSINGHNTNLEADDTNWAVSDPGSAICHVDKPYFVRSSSFKNNVQWQFALKITIYLRVSMKLLLKLKIVHRAANLQKVLLTKSPPPCQARERLLVLSGVVADDKQIAVAAFSFFQMVLFIHFLIFPSNTYSLKRYPTAQICMGAHAICLRHIPCRTTSDFLLRKTMKTLFMLSSLALLAVIVQGGEESGKKVEPLPCKDRGSKATCNRYMQKDNFQELCKENRRIGRYLCCKTCAEKLGVEVDEDGKFKDFGTFTYYEPTCPALEDRGNHTICEMIKHGSEVYKCDQSEAQAACAKTCNLTSIRMCTPVGKVFTQNHMKTRQYKFRAIVYKAPAQDTGKIILAGAVGNWDNSQAAFTAGQGHSFAKTLEHVVGTHASVKFLAYNNVPPGIPNVKTKSNSKGVIILSTAADSAAWVVHTIPGFPTAKTPYAWPASETARGHLLICLTISKSQINAIAASLLLAQPVIHYNDIPETETAGMPYFKKLTEGKTRVMPPFTSRRTIRTKNGGAPVTVHIYSKSETSKYEIYKKVIVKALKKTIKVWSRRDSKLKGDCRVPERHIRLLKSPGVINGHNTNIEADDTNWAVSDPGSVICHVDKPYFKNQSKEPAMAICIENNDIFTRFNEIAAQKRSSAIKGTASIINVGGPFHEASVFRVKNGYSPGQYRRFSAMLEPFHGMLLAVLLLPQAVSKDVENDLSEPVTDAVSENCEMEQSENVLNEELDRHVEQEKKPKQLVMLIQIEREKPKSGLYVEYTAEMKFRVNEKSVQMYKPRLKKTVNVADAGMNAVQSFI
ncbi:Deoxyribonuclease-2-beta, partial [Trichinella spiralis]